MGNLPGSDRKEKNAALIAAVMASFLTPFMGSSINIALPHIGREFHMDTVSLGWVTTVYLLAAAVSLLPMGKLADIYGRKKIFLYGIVLFSIVSGLTAFAPNGIILILLRALHGLSSSMIFGTGVAILTSVFPPGERGKAIGITVSAVYVGLSSGPFLGGIITDGFGWRGIFILPIPIGILVITQVIIKLTGEYAGEPGQKMDFVGTFIYAVALSAFMWGLSDLPNVPAIVAVVAGSAGLAVFVVHQNSIRSPLLKMRLFMENMVFAFSNLAALIHYAATFGIAYLMSLYLQDVMGYSAQVAGLILVAQPLIMAAGSPIAGRLSDQFEPRYVASAGMALTAFGLFCFSRLGENTSIQYIIVVLVGIVLGYALFSSPNTNAVMSSVTREHYGVAAATVGTMRLLGQMTSMAVAMLVLSNIMGKIQITEANTDLFVKSVNTVFLIFFIMGIGGVFSSMARGRLRK